MLRPSGSLLASSRAAQRRTVRLEVGRLATALVRRTSAAVADVAGTAVDLSIMLGLPMLYAVAAYLTLDLPARLLAGRVHFTAFGLLVFLCAVCVSLLGVSRMLHEAGAAAPADGEGGAAAPLRVWLAIGVAATAALGRFERLERLLLGREPSYAPARVAERLLGSRRFGPLLRWTYGPALGVAYGALRSRFRLPALA